MDITLYQTLSIFYDYLPVYKIWIQCTNLFKRYQTQTIFGSWKEATTPIITGGFYPKSNIIFYDYIPVFKIWIQYTHLFKRYWTETIFGSWNGAITPIIIGGQTWPIFNDKIPVYITWIQFTDLFKRYWRQTFFRSFFYNFIFKLKQIHLQSIGDYTYIWFT